MLVKHAVTMLTDLIMSLENKIAYFTYNLETTDLKKNKNAEVCQIGVLSTNGQKFCRYILPKSNFKSKASEINGFTISTIEGERALLLKGRRVETISQDKAFKEFFGFLRDNSPKNDTIVLVAYHSVHDETFLERICNEFSIPLKVEGRKLRFADACTRVIKLRDSGEWPLGKNISRKDVHQFLHGTTVLNAAGSHDAMVDVQLLMEIIRHDRYPNAKNVVAMTEPDIKQEMNVLQELEESQMPSTIKSPVGQKRKQMQSSILDPENMKRSSPEEEKKPRLF